MKDFFTQCMEDLEFTSGKRQLHWMKQGCETQSDFDRKKAILINSMVIVSKEFEYIPEQAQKRIIEGQIIKDQDYEGLYSSTIWKWLNAFKGPYLNPAQLQDKEVVFEPQSEETKKMIHEWQMNLLDKPKLTLVELEKEKIIAEDAAMLSGEVKQKSESAHYKVDPEKIVMQELRRQYAKECTNLVTGRTLEGMPSFDEWLAME